MFALFLYPPQLLKESSHLPEAALANSKYSRLTFFQTGPPLLPSVQAVVTN